MSNNIKNRENKKVSAKKAEKKSQTVLYRLLMVLAFDIIGVASLISVKKEAGRESFFVFKVLPVLTWVLVGLSVLAAGYYVFTKVKKINVSKYICTPLMLLGTIICGLLICVLYKSISLQKIVIMIIAVSLLYFIYYLYKHSFWLYAVYTAGAYLVLSLLGSATYFAAVPELHTAVKITAVVIAVVAGIFVLTAKVKGGTISFGKTDINLYEDSFDVIPFSVTTGILLIASAVSFFTAILSIYMSALLLASFLVITIIYTIKMM